MVIHNQDQVPTKAFRDQAQVVLYYTIQGLAQGVLFALRSHLARQVLPPLVGPARPPILPLK